MSSGNVKGPALAVSWVARAMAAAILGMAGGMKLMGAPDSVALFTTLGAEPVGRLALGALEVATAILLLWPGRTFLGALVAAVLMVGAIGAHLTQLGIMYGGGPSLFLMAAGTLASAGMLLYLHRPRPV